MYTQERAGHTATFPLYSLQGYPSMTIDASTTLYLTVSYGLVRYVKSSTDYKSVLTVP